MSISTRTGDHGTSGLMFNRRVSKHDGHLEAIGTVDELTSAIGVARARVPAEEGGRLLAVQHVLVTLMSELAVLPDDVARYREAGHPALGPLPLASLDAWLTELEHGLGLRFEGWAIPGANETAAAFDWARAICRRAERRVSALADSTPVDEEIPRYLNRLADLLWLLARRFEKNAESSVKLREA